MSEGWEGKNLSPELWTGSKEENVQLFCCFVNLHLDHSISGTVQIYAVRFSWKGVGSKMLRERKKENFSLFRSILKTRPHNHSLSWCILVLFLYVHCHSTLAVQEVLPCFVVLCWCFVPRGLSQLSSADGQVKEYVIFEMVAKRGLYDGPRIFV